jgi:SHS family lactate transporter-like MFS transporter
VISGLLQSGYPCGFFIAALANWLLVDHIGWRGLFVVGAAPALLVLYIRRKVPESKVWLEQRRTQPRMGLRESMRGQWKLALYLMILMAAFNMFSHGSQDMYPTFLQVNLHIPAGSGTAFMLTALLNIGALVGGLYFGSLSERIGRRKAIIIAALLAIPVIPLWMYGGSLLLLGLGAFLIQVMVQGAWGVVPTHLNELSPDHMRGTLPGFAYQMGNLLAAITATAQTWIAQWHGGDFAFAMSLWIGAVALLLVLLTWLGPEAHGVGFGKARVR